MTSLDSRCLTGPIALSVYIVRQPLTGKQTHRSDVDLHQLSRTSSLLATRVSPSRRHISL